MARPAERHRQLAHDLHSHESLGKEGALDRVFTRLQEEQIIAIRIEHVLLDSTTVKVHPDGTGALKKAGPKPSASPAADAPPRFIWLPQMLGAP